MSRRMKWVATAAVAVAALGIGSGIAVASAGDEDQPIPPNALDQATAAALEHTGGGEVVDSEVGENDAAENEPGDNGPGTNGYYEVEVRLKDGTEVEVNLDRDFNVIESHAESEDE